MNFSETIPYSYCTFSHQCNYLAVAKGSDLYVSILNNIILNKIKVFDSEKLQTVQKYSIPSEITFIEFSPDDQFLLALVPKKN